MHLHDNTDDAPAQAREGIKVVQGSQISSA